MHRTGYAYLEASDFDTVIRFDNPDFLKERDIITIETFDHFSLRMSRIGNIYTIPARGRLASLLYNHRSPWYRFHMRGRNLDDLATFRVITARSELRKVLFLAHVCDVFVRVWNISGTAERICAKFTGKTCFVPRSGEFECQGQRSRSPGTKTGIFRPFRRPMYGLFGKTSLDLVLAVFSLLIRRNGLFF